MKKQKTKLIPLFYLKAVEIIAMNRSRDKIVQKLIDI